MDFPSQPGAPRGPADFRMTSVDVVIVCPEAWAFPKSLLKDINASIEPNKTLNILHDQDLTSDDT